MSLNNDNIIITSNITSALSRNLPLATNVRVFNDLIATTTIVVNVVVSCLSLQCKCIFSRIKSG